MAWQKILDVCPHGIDLSTGPCDRCPAADGDDSAFRLDTAQVGLADDLMGVVGMTHAAAMKAAGLSTADGSTCAFLGDLALEVARELGVVIDAITARLNALADGRP